MIDFVERLLSHVHFIPNSFNLNISDLFDSEIGAIRNSEDFRNRVKARFFNLYNKYLIINYDEAWTFFKWSYNPEFKDTISLYSPNTEIILIASYNVGDEYESKLLHVKRLKNEGLNICIGHLYELFNDRLPNKMELEERIFERLKLWATETEILNFAFHSGWMMQMNIEYYHKAIKRFKVKYSQINCLIEPLDWYSTNKEPEIVNFNKDLDSIFNLKSSLIDKIWNG
jgi:hypothetical protein